MSVIGSSILAGASGAAGGGEKVYIDDVFSTFVYKGTGAAKTITNGIDISGEGGLVWIKNRTNSNHSNILFDTERGALNGLLSNATSASASYANSLTAFNSTGFTVGSMAATNYSGGEFVSWTFRKAPGFFDVVTWNGDGTDRDISHNLGSIPGMIIVKRTDSADDWVVYHRSVNLSFLLNEPDAGNTYTGYIQNPTSTTFEVAPGVRTNATGGTYVAYIFAHDDAQFGTGGDESIIKCGSYTGNGTSGRTVDLGFEPQWFLVKRSDSSDDWRIFDSMRSFANGVDNQPLYANTATAEGDNNNIGATATGVVINETNYANANGGTYIYMAIRRPHKPPEAATDVFAIDTRGGTSPTPPEFNSGFVTDFAIRKKATTVDSPSLVSRLTGTQQMYSDSSAAQSGNSNFKWDYMNGWWDDTYVLSTEYSWMFKRAPGFMDVVAYSGNSTSNRAVPHNLEVTPELLILKKRQPGNEHWMVQYTGVFGTNTALQLSTAGAASSQAAFNSTSAATASNFYLGADSSSNGTGKTYIVYLFATLPGISKVGSYSGNTGYAINVDCGFTNGARFILIKRSDSTGDWYVWDTTRGIVSGNDPYLLLNSTAAQVTNTDYIDPNVYGFTVTATAPAALNATGGTYLFLAIA